MKTKELEKYPLQILMMTLTSFLTLLIPKLLSYLIDDILMANNKEKILPWFMITFGVTSLLMIMKFYFITYNPIKIGIKNTFRLQIKAAKDILNMNQSVYADEDKGYYYNVCSNSCAAYGDLYEEIHLRFDSHREHSPARELRSHQADARGSLARNASGTVCRNPGGRFADYLPASPHFHQLRR